ncbi:alpha/beta hydrolase [Ectothiorhodospiraceae bacterium WFHF3C12]|nr:alpha/beta hydrolase [Ectothiorhodospiraceae bacterium WFHF3C12]
MPAIPTLITGPADAPLTLVLAHGAGAGMDTPFMETMAEGLAAAGWRVVRFEFPYMTRAREEGRRRPPDAQGRLLDTWRSVIDQLGGPEGLVLGGKSMSGRMASLMAARVRPAGLLVLGYPFHPPGKPDRPRIEHLGDLRCPALILQGERDSFGKPDEVAGYDLPEEIRLAWVPDGDHSFKPRKRSGHSEAGNLAWAVAQADAFLRGLAGLQAGWRSS